MPKTKHLVKAWRKYKIVGQYVGPDAICVPGSGRSAPLYVLPDAAQKLIPVFEITPVANYAGWKSSEAAYDCWQDAAEDGENAPYMDDGGVLQKAVDAFFAGFDSVKKKYTKVVFDVQDGPPPDNAVATQETDKFVVLL